MIKLYMYGAAFGLRNPSPFCLKVEMALKYLGLDYEIELLGDPRKAPKGKLPWALIARLARAGVRKAVDGQGLGRHSSAEQKRFLGRDLEAISDVAGARMTVFDFAVAAQVSSMLDNRPATWATGVADEFPALEGYAERVQQAAGVYGRELSSTDDRRSGVEVEPTRPAEA